MEMPTQTWGHTLVETSCSVVCDLLVTCWFEEKPVGSWGGWIFGSWGVFLWGSCKCGWVVVGGGWCGWVVGIKPLPEPVLTDWMAHPMTKTDQVCLRLFYWIWMTIKCRHPIKQSLFREMVCCQFGTRLLAKPGMTYCKIGYWEQTLVKFDKKNFI